MTPIKYRGLRADNNEMVEGYYYSQKFYNKFSEEKELLWHKHFIKGIDDLFNEIFESVEVRVETLGLFSGRLDENEKEIFVGDVLSDKWKVEVYQNDEGTFMVKFHTNPELNKSKSLKKYLSEREKAGTSTCEGYRDCIVIGNIHQNKDLLQ